MGEALYPSGPWTGFYNYSPSDKHRMDLNLEFHNGGIVGEGIDDVGRFLVKGSYDPGAGECHWVKTYPGSHDVYYHGFREGKGIWGTWNIELGVGGHGGFHIWPKSTPSTESCAEHQTEPIKHPAQKILAIACAFPASERGTRAPQSFELSFLEPAL